MNRKDIARIQSALGVSLPPQYVRFLTEARDASSLDEDEVLADAEVIIDSTQSYRRGFAGLSPWPNKLVYVGDQADACPYAIDCDSGEVLRIHKGNLNVPPMQRWTSFDEFRQSLEASLAEVSAAARPSRDWIIPKALFFIFVVVPLIMYGVTTFFRSLLS